MTRVVLRSAGVQARLGGQCFNALQRTESLSRQGSREIRVQRLARIFFRAPAPCVASPVPLLPDSIPHL